MNPSISKGFIAELLGTFFLALVTVTLMLNAGTVGYVNLYLPCGVALAYGLLTYCLQDAGGFCFNPAVAFGLFMVRKLSASVMLASLIAELLGAYLGIAVGHYLTPSQLIAPQGISLVAELGELLGAMLLVFAVTRIQFGQVPAAVSGLVASAALLVAMTIAQAVSGGLLNPAIAIGLGAFHLSYLLMPLLGAAAGAFLARLLQPAILPTI